VKRRHIVLLSALAVAVGIGSEAWGQLFGQRNLGRTRSRPQRPTMTRQTLENVGSVDANARYVRGNRDTSDFVGTDSRDQQGFVGLQQAEGTGQIRSAVDNLRVRTGPDANRTAQSSSRRRSPMYDPRLSIDFDFRRPGPEDLSARLVGRLESSLRLAETSWIEVSLEAGKATLRGEVASERSRRLARLMLLLEPGISDVQNDLVVKPPQSPPSERRPSEPTGPSEDRS
jgi:osmotically-inducible protein OsmY